jgi:hypothetical protein
MVIVYPENNANTNAILGRIAEHLLGTCSNHALAFIKELTGIQAMYAVRRYNL